MARYTISDKLLLKWNQENLDLHKRCLKTYLVSEGVSATGRKKFFKLYDAYINAKNVMRWFYIPVDLFVKILLYNQLEEMANYTWVNNNIKKKTKKK